MLMGRLLVIVPLLLLCACGGRHAGPQGGAAERAPVHALSARAGRPLALRSGQILVTDSGGPSALFFSLFSGRFAPFVHAGILSIEDGDAYVYETYGVFRPGLGGRPTDRVVGKVERTPLDDYVRKGRYVEVYAPPEGVDRGRVIAFARERFLEGTPFDPYFRVDDEQAYYCTEFVAAALHAGGAAMPPLLPFPANPSLTRVRSWLGIDGPGTIHAQQLIHPDRLVGALSRLESPQAFVVYVELKRELHRRFTPDQRLGNLFEWDGAALRFREPVADFLVAGFRLYEGARELPGPAEIRARVRRLADTMLGPLPGEARRSSGPPTAPASLDRAQGAGGPLSGRTRN